MTTIAYRDGVIAADTLITENGRKVGRIIKIGRLGPLLYGAAGTLSQMQRFHDFIRGGLKGDPPRMKDDEGTESTGILIQGPNILTLSCGGWDRMHAEFYAVGSGAAVALGAMAAGATAKQAVRAAMSLDVWSGGELTSLSRTG